MKTLVWLELESDDFDVKIGESELEALSKSLSLGPLVFLQELIGVIPNSMSSRGSGSKLSP